MLLIRNRRFILNPSLSPSPTLYHISYLGLGSNLNNPVQQIADACQNLQQSSSITLVDKSPLYESMAMTSSDEQQPNYINSVVKCQVTCSPLELLNIVKEIEQRMGRKPEVKRWQARLIDIDILWFENVSMNSKELTIPHPGLINRPFALLPLRDLEPDLELGYRSDMPSEDSSTKYKVRDLALKIKDEWNTTRIYT